MKSRAGLMHCGPVHCSGLHERVYVFISGHSLGFPSQTPSELTERLCVIARDVTGTVYDLWLQMKNRQNSSNDIAHIYVQLSINCGTLTVSSIISRSPLTADLFSAAHYKESDQTTDIWKHINQRHQKHRRGAEHILWFVWTTQSVSHVTVV